VGGGDPEVDDNTAVSGPDGRRDEEDDDAEDRGAADVDEGEPRELVLE